MHHDQQGGRGHAGQQILGGHVHVGQGDHAGSEPDQQGQADGFIAETRRTQREAQRRPASGYDHHCHEEADAQGGRDRVEHQVGGGGHGGERHSQQYQRRDDAGEFRAAGEQSVCQERTGERLVAKKCHQVARHIAERGQRLETPHPL